MTSVVVLDYGSGNLRSAQRAVARAGAEVIVTSDLDAAVAADGLVVPGVGAFAACMAGIDALGAGAVIAERVAAGRPVLGICVGMQVLFEYGEEHGVVTKGLGMLPGAVTRLAAQRLPHMGWNTVDAPPGSVLFADLPAGTRFYFVHSYAVAEVGTLAAAGATVTTATHETRFVAGVERGALSAVQFHPEKSADGGAILLRNWLATL
jgi:glutamine amidotransferase